MFRGTVRTIHLIGIGGIGMSGIAEVLLSLGFVVQGTDLREGESVRRLRDLGAIIHLGHDPAHLGDADVVVRSTAVGPSNPEVRAALDRGTPVIRRAEMLAELMRLKLGVAVAGSHGKTTTTSMIAQCLGSAGLDPTVIIGGRLDSLGGSNARRGGGDWMVAEADESDGSFLLLQPTVAVVTNIDPEHLDHYGDFDALKAAFVAFVNAVPFYGAAVMCQDHPVVQQLLPDVRRRVITYGLARHADFRATQLRAQGMHSTFTVHHGDELLGEVTLGMPGEHNVVNALGAIAVGWELGLSFAAIQRGLHRFTGVQRRFTVRGEAAGVIVVDDYGHHPAEIEATLLAAERGFPDRRVFAVFQPHRYSRVHGLLDDFCGSFSRADEVVVCPVYAAGEAPIDGLDAASIAGAMRTRGHRATTAVASLDEAVSLLAQRVSAGDLVITLGAGDVHKVCAGLLARLAEAAPAGSPSA